VLSGPCTALLIIETPGRLTAKWRDRASLGVPGDSNTGTDFKVGIRDDLRCVPAFAGDSLEQPTSGAYMRSLALIVRSTIRAASAALALSIQLNEMLPCSNYRTDGSTPYPDREILIKLS